MLRLENFFGEILLEKLWIPLRSAHTRRPAYTFRQNSLRHLTFETPFPRFYRAQKTGGMNGACAPFGGRRARCARTGGARCARAAWGDGPVGPFGVIPKPFRMVSYSEAISNGKLSRSQSDWKGHSEWMALPNRKLFHVVTHIPCVHAVGKTPSRMAVIWLDFDAPPPPHPQDQRRGARGPMTHGTLWGMPKPFRRVSCSEPVRMERTFRMGYSVGSLRRENAEPNVSGFVWLDLGGFE